jgi:hypothetical protein
MVEYFLSRSRNKVGEIGMDLGTIQDIPLKALWAGEATHFTPWLAENIGLLGEKLGIDLQLESIDVDAGDFAADIVARDLSNNRKVVIENQYGSTDHRHLGQIITNASVLGAGAVVWIAETIRPEHKSALDFLNANLKESLSLYAVQASAFRIDKSRPAFNLTVVSMPNEAAVIPEEAPSASETQENYRKFYQALIDDLREKHAFTNARRGQPQNWYSFASDNSRVYKYSASFANGGRVRVELYIDCGDKAKNEALFDCLYARRNQIDALLGQSSEWERLDNRRACRVSISRDGDIDADSDTLANIKDWLIQGLLKFREVFPAHVETCLRSIGSL